MELPPGIIYLLGSFPAYFIPALLVYISLTLLREHRWLGFDIPQWLIVALAICSRPIWITWGVVCNKLMRRKVAASLGAVIPPVVQEWSIFTVSKFAETLRHGYPST
jgi:hypothetical protein